MSCVRRQKYRNDAGRNRKGLLEWVKRGDDFALGDLELAALPTTIPQYSSQNTIAYGYC